MASKHDLSPQICVTLKVMSKNAENLVLILRILVATLKRFFEVLLFRPQNSGFHGLSC
jgi:hypothetical protein